MNTATVIFVLGVVAVAAFGFYLDRRERHKKHH